MRSPRGLSESEAAAWAALAASVTPIRPKESPPVPEVPAARRLTEGDKRKTLPPKPEAPRPLGRPSAPSPLPAGEDRSGLDSHWERRLRAGTLSPDFTLDLHEHSLDAAYSRLLGGLDIARETGARVVLVIAGRERPGPAADRSGQRGAIRAKLLDWLAASRHASAIATIRKAHRRHGGDGALYVILKKAR
ncbi:MAG: DNA mismatch repair protein MutS [Sphingomonadales bacterium]|nr:MAG: DNA mismatch repair protein MutS [Sphingomonadales bacterium]